MQTESIKELVKNVTHANKIMTEEPVTERGWILKVNCKDQYIIFDGADVTLTPNRAKASFYQNYSEAIEEVKSRAGDLDLRLVIAERVKRDKV